MHSSASDLEANSITRLMGRVPQSVWAMGDQAVVSLGNFATNTLLVNNLSKEEFGRYGLLLETLLFINSLHAALIIYPLSIHAATGDTSRLGRWTTTALSLGAWLQPLLGVAMFITALSAGSWQIAALVTAAMLAWQIQETTRRTLMAGLRFAATIPGDTISYAGQALSVLLLIHLDRLSVSTTLAAMALTSLLAAGLQMLQVRPARPAKPIKESAGEFWHVGRWMLGANLTGLAILFCNYWALEYFHGYEAVAVFAALTIFMKVTHPIMTGIGSLMVPSIARANHNEGFSRTGFIFVRYALFGTLLLGPYLLFIMIFPEWGIRILLRKTVEEYLPYAGLLRLFALNYFVYYLASVLGAWAAAVGESRIGFISQAVNAGVTVVVALPLIIWLGVPGIIYGGLIAITCTALTTVALLIRHNKRTPPGSSSA